MKGCPKDKTLEKTIQESWKYNSTSMHVSETKLKKEKVELKAISDPNRGIFANSKISKIYEKYLFVS